MNLAILGLGLIGGSLGLAVRATWPRAVVVGWDRDPASMTLALKRGAITAAVADPAAAVVGATVVVVATPVSAVETVFTAIAPHLARETVVSDVSSTKGQVMAWAARELQAGQPFVGGHPMAGSEKSGVAHARVNLFRGARYCLTPTPGCPPAALARLEDLAIAVGARPLILDAATHDAYVAAISHVPFVVSTALVRLTTGDPHWPDMQALAATGYRDITRLASGDPRMYADICATNAAAMAPLLRALADDLSTFADGLDAGISPESHFCEARGRREAWLVAQESFHIPN